MEALQQHKKAVSFLDVSALYYRQATYDEAHMMMKNIGRLHDPKENNGVQSSDDSNYSSSIGEVSSNSKESCSSSSDLLDDASSSPSSSSSPSPRSNSPLFELSELMDQLPIKRGLSKYYQGKSQSFTTLARVTSVDDLAKKETEYQRKLKACRSYAGGLNHFKSYTQPKATISKKASKSNLSCLTRKRSFVGSPRPAQSPAVQSIF